MIVRVCLDATLRVLLLIIAICMRKGAVGRRCTRRQLCGDVGGRRLARSGGYACQLGRCLCHVVCRAAWFPHNFLHTMAHDGTRGRPRDARWHDARAGHLEPRELAFSAQRRLHALAAPARSTRARGEEAARASASLAGTLASLAGSGRTAGHRAKSAEHQLAAPNSDRPDLLYKLPTTRIASPVTENFL